MGDDGAEVIKTGSVACGRRYVGVLVDLFGFPMPVGAAEHCAVQPFALKRFEGGVCTDLQLVVRRQVQAVIGRLAGRDMELPLPSAYGGECQLPVVGEGLDTGGAIGGPHFQSGSQDC
jgi:hypothetical protein